MRLLQDVFSKKLRQESLDPVGIIELQKPIRPSRGLWSPCAKLRSPLRADQFGA
jgi:hypothetical protein